MTFQRFGSAEQHLEGARAALPKIISMLYSNFPTFDVEQKVSDGLAYLLIYGPSINVMVFAGAYQDFTAYDVSNAGTVRELFTAVEYTGAKDRRVKPLSWSIEELRKALEVLELKT